MESLHEPARLGFKPEHFVERVSGLSPIAGGQIEPLTLLPPRLGLCGADERRSNSVATLRRCHDDVYDSARSDLGVEPRDDVRSYQSDNFAVSLCHLDARERIGLEVRKALGREIDRRWVPKFRYQHRRDHRV